MAADCSIPCSAQALYLHLRGRMFGDGTYERLPVIGGAIVLGIAGVVVALLVAPAVTAVVVALWAALGVLVAFGQAWLGSGTPARLAMPDELVRLVEANAERIHPSRVPALRERAARLSLGQPNFDTYATHLLLDLREATGEAWHCPCPKRRLPLPLTF
jgi:hypothetical protein